MAGGVHGGGERPARQLPRVAADAATPDEAEARLYLGLYGCTMHPGGLLHAITACVQAEADGRYSLADIAARVTVKAEAARDAAPSSDAWRYDAMITLCTRLVLAAPRVAYTPPGPARGHVHPP